MEYDISEEKYFFRRGGGRGKDSGWITTVVTLFYIAIAAFNAPLIVYVAHSPPRVYWKKMIKFEIKSFAAVGLMEKFPGAPRKPFEYCTDIIYYHA